MKKKSLIELLVAMAMVSFIIFIAYQAVNGYIECSDQGGTYVRGLLWFECYEGR